MASSTSQWKNDVFLSYKGGDTSNGFVNHLFDVLRRNRIVTFKGDVEDCCVSVIVFSENYAFSPLCLDELVKIVHCQHKGQILVPIFYKVEPTDVQQLTGRFGDAILQHKNEFTSSLVDAWIQALKAVSELTGFVLWNIRHETKLIEEIVDHILETLSHAVSTSSHDGLVGIDSRVKDIEALLLDIESENVLFLGIWGMGGIGKSTIARKVFNQISSQFEGRSFVANVQEKLERCSLDSLRREIICKVLGKRSSNLGMPTMLSHSTRQQIKRKKVLIVLDDVADLAQMEYLVGECSIYGPGSRIIITSKDKQLLINGGAKIYEVKKLHFREALHLFSLHAFKKSSPAEMHMKLATRAINYAQGIPLALKVLGSNLYNKSVSKWEDEFEKLGNISDQNIQKILRISYDELEEEEKDIFLDIACFFKSEDKDLIESILDSNGFFARIELSRLLDKSLITISENNFDMHDLLQQMGRDIVCRECIEEPGKRSRLWISKDIFQVLTKDEGTSSIEGIFLDISKIRDMTLSSTAFMRMHKIRFLKIYHPFYHIKETYDSRSGDIKVHLSEGLRFLPDKLKYLHWYQYPLNSLPSNFCPKNLVQLYLIHSHVERLFMEDQSLESLTFIDLSYSMKLIEIPDLSRFPKLEVLYLRGCTSLIEICSSIQYDSKLTDVDLGYCKNLCRFSSFLYLGKLNSLSLNGCSRISEFPKIPPSIKCLVLNEVSIQHVPLTIGHCSGLTELRLKSCTWLESLPSNIGELKSLERLDVEGCSKLMNLPDSICNLKSLKSLVINKCLNISELPVNLGNLKSLKTLRAAESGIKTLPSSINQLSQLIDLSCDGCKGLKLPSFTAGLSRLSCLSLKNCGLLEISNSFSSLVSLARLYLEGNNLEELPPDCLEKLPRLRKLDLRDCRRLRHLSDIPSALNHVIVRNCESLKSISLSQKNMDFLMLIDAANCANLDLNACTEIIDDVLLSDRPVVASHCSPEPYDFLEEGKELHVRYGRGLNIVGGEVPPRMRYQNKNGSYLSYSFTPDPRRFIALAFCAVAAPNIYPSRHFRLVGCKCSFEGKSGHSIHFQSEDIIDAKNMMFQSEHVFFWSSITEFNFSYSFTKASFEFYIVDEGGYSSELIKKCGIHPFNDDDNDIDLSPSEHKNSLGNCFTYSP